MTDPFDDPDPLTVDQLEKRVAVKTAEGVHMWKHEAWPGEMSDGKRERWTVRVMEIATVGDELWWFCSPPETWEHLCGRAGWVLVRDGRGIDFECTVLNGSAGRGAAISGVK